MATRGQFTGRNGKWMVGRKVGEPLVDWWGLPAAQFEADYFTFKRLYLSHVLVEIISVVRMICVYSKKSLTFCPLQCNG